MGVDAESIETIGLLTDFIFLSDVAFNFRTGLAESNGNICMDARIVRDTYLRSWFLVDLISSIPLGFISRGMFSNSFKHPIKLVKVAKIAKAFRTLQPLLLTRSHLALAIDTVIVDPLPSCTCHRHCLCVGSGPHAGQAERHMCHDVHACALDG